MAELNVQPKKKTSFLPWLALLLVAIILIWFLSTRNKNDDKFSSSSDAKTPATTAAVTNSNGNITDWTAVDFNAPAVEYEEITNKNINVHGTDNYGIYGLGENILFDEGKAVIRPDAEANLKEVSASINKRYNNGEIRIYGYTDANGSAAANKELAQQRADAVKIWLQNNGHDAAHISENAIGEAQPVATNSTEKGRSENRRVEIVARAANASK